LLDAGCGTGGDAITLAAAVQPGGEVVGIDTSAAAIDAARARAGAQAAVRFELADVAELPFPDRSFDAARADRVLLHLDRPVVAVHQLVRVLRPGGRIAFTEGRFEGIQWLPGRSPSLPVHGDVLPALPLILEHLGVGEVTVEATAAAVDLGADASEVIGIRPGTLRLALVHVAGTRLGP
jgi:SAM-dependent methyltransferase